VIVVAINFLAHLPNERLDLTEDSRYTLPPAAERIAASLEDTLTINVYMSKALPTYISHVPGIVRNRLDEFQDASKGLIEFSFIDPLEDKELEEELTDLKMVPSKLRDYDDGKLSEADYYMWLEFQYQDQRDQFNLLVLSRALMDPATLMATLPYNIAARIVKVQNAEQAIGVVSEKKMPPAQARPGQPRPQPTAGISSFRKGVESHYPELRDVVIGPGNPIRGDVTTLILYRPENLSQRAIYEIDQYLMRGNRVLLMLDNYSLFDLDKQQEFGQGLQQNALLPARALNHNLKDWLKHYGVLVSEGYVEDESCASVVRFALQRTPQGLRRVQQRSPVPAFVTVREKDQDGEPTGQFDAKSPVFTGLGMATMLFPTPLQVDRDAMSVHVDAEVNDLIRTSPKAWVREPEDGKIALYSQPPEPPIARGSHVLVAEAHGKFTSFFADKERPKKINAAGNEMQDPATVADKLDASAAPGHLWVFADGDFLSEWWGQIVGVGMMRSGPIPSQEAANGIARMATGLINAMDAITLGSQDLVEIRKPVLSDRSLRKTSVDTNKSDIRLWTLLLTPALLVLFGLVNWGVRSAVNRIPSPQGPAVQGSSGAADAEEKAS
jgi:ABC-type uncharacterized transport system involved in gliding motility auxiliary subunit